MYMVYCIVQGVDHQCSVAVDQVTVNKDMNDQGRVEQSKPNDKVLEKFERIFRKV